MSDLRSIQPEDLLDRSQIEKYFALREAVGVSLTEINRALFILRRLEPFPFELLGLRVMSQPMWGAFEASLLEAVIIRIRALAMDPTSDSLWSLRALVATAIRAEFKDALCAELVALNFNDEVIDVLKRINKLRNKAIAHFELAFQKKLETVKLKSLDELELVTKALVAQFELLSFGFGRGTVLMAYLGPEDGLIGERGDTDVDLLLKLVAGNSELLNRPEECQEFWDAKKDDLDFQPTRTLVNDWRKQLGKDPK